jgi:hypothetical protein
MNIFYKIKFYFTALFLISCVSNVPIQQGSGGGSLYWTKQMGVSGGNISQIKIATDNLQNIYVSGATDKGLGGNLQTGSSDLFLTKYSSLGEYQWTKQMGVTLSTTTAANLAIDQSQNIYVTGYTTGGLDGNTPVGSTDAFLVKYNADGIKQWTRLLGSSARSVVGSALKVDSAQNIYVTGYASAGIDGNTQTGSLDLFLTKYNINGEKQWSKQLGSPGAGVYPVGMAIDSGQNIYISGYTNGGFDGNILTGSMDLFITKFNNDGIKIWTKQMGVATFGTYGMAVAVDASQNIFVSGFTNGGLDGNTLSGSRDLILVKFNPDGIKQWTQQFGVTGKQVDCRNIAVDSNQNIFLTGYTTAGLDGNSLTGAYDVFLVKYSNNGNREWSQQFGSSTKTSIGYGMDTDISGNLFISGTTTGGVDGNTLSGIQDLFIAKYSNSGTKF